ncbi:helix-turn-helix domain-containing protein [Oceanobacillus timonensis]|uniref:helix-turn-helix domain-containing protein n=1 Tax=Oceanobacillus timonensis TaxID=1926285 RepID=UPI0009BC2FC8|nr:XRE family transcriptional regulator [Oceanobacillus timonensis]
MNQENDESKEVVMQIGSVLRKLRKEKQLSLEDLSELSGVSKLTLGNIERGETNPTIAVLWKISKSLSIPLMSIFSKDTNVTLSRTGEGFKITGDDNNWSIEPIFQDANAGIETYRAYLQPNSTYIPETHPSNTTETVTVMTGNITLQIDESYYHLKEYDSIHFTADTSHSYINHSEEKVVLHMMLRYGI